MEIKVGMKFGNMTVIGCDDSKKMYFLCKCSCGEIKSIKKYSIIESINRGAKSHCGKCNSFERWCKHNNHQDYLELWDYDLNSKNPNEVAYGTSKKYYFKCENNIHKSELYSINKITNNGHKTTCRKCSSFGHYLINKNEMGIWSHNNKKDAYDVKKGSDVKYFLICPSCKREKEIAPVTYVHHGLGCSCSDGNSYPNKFVVSLLSQLEIGFETEKVFEWSKGKRYDIYIASINLIIENHGIQHYKKSNRGRSLQEEQDNDSYKEKVARSNGMQYYIQLDCRKSDLEWVKSSIMNSELPTILNFKECDIDWVECEKFSRNSVILEACSLYKKLGHTKSVAKELNISRRTATIYLIKGSKLGLCDYDPKLAMKDKTIRNRGSNHPNSKKVICDGITFGNISECAEFYGIRSNRMASYLRDDRQMPQEFCELGLSYI